MSADDLDKLLAKLAAIGTLEASTGASDDAHEFCATVHTTYIEPEKFEDIEFQEELDKAKVKAQFAVDVLLAVPALAVELVALREVADAARGMLGDGPFGRGFTIAERARLAEALAKVPQ